MFGLPLQEWQRQLFDMPGSTNIGLSVQVFCIIMVLNLHLLMHELDWKRISNSSLPQLRRSAEARSVGDIVKDKSRNDSRTNSQPCEHSGQFRASETTRVMQHVFACDVAFATALASANTHNLCSLLALGNA